MSIADERTRVLRFLKLTEDDLPGIKDRCISLMGGPPMYEGVKLVRGWKYDYLSRVGSGYAAPSRGGSSNQVDGIMGNVYAWLLFNDQVAWQTAQVRARSLLDRVGIEHKGVFDQGHLQRWDSSIIVAVGLNDLSLIASWLTAYDRHRNNGYFSGGPGHGIRPQFRSYGQSFAFAWFLERLIMDGYPVPGYYGIPDELRKAATSYGYQLFKNRVDTGFLNLPQYVYADPVRRWPYVAASTEYGVGDHVQPFHFTWVMPSTMHTASHYGAKIKSRWMLGVRMMARWAWDMLYDPMGEEVYESGSRHTFTPSIMASKGGRYKDWNGTDRAKFGSHQYHFLPWFLALGKGSKRVTMREMTRLLATRKNARVPGEVEASVVWEAMRRISM